MAFRGFNSLAGPKNFGRAFWRKLQLLRKFSLGLHLQLIIVDLWRTPPNKTTGGPIKSIWREPFGGRVFRTEGTEPPCLWSLGGIYRKKTNKPKKRSDIWVFPKIMGPPNHPFVHRVFHEINHPFCFSLPLFLDTSIWKWFPTNIIKYLHKFHLNKSDYPTGNDHISHLKGKGKIIDSKRVLGRETLNPKPYVSSRRLKNA